MDLTVEAEAFGAEIVFPENEVPSVVGRLLANEEDIEKLNIPALNKGRVPQYLKANMLAKLDNNGQTCLCRLHRPLLIGRTFV